MKKIKNYLERKFDNPYKLYIEESEESLLENKLETEEEKNEFVSKRINKHTIENAIMREYLCWEKVPEGFEFRSNFHFNEETGYLEFNTSRILKTPNGYISDGTDLSNCFMELENNQRMLKNLTKIHAYFEELKRKNSSDLPETREDNYIKFRNSQPHKEMFIAARLEHLRRYLQNYGKTGKDFLIKWLNLLSNPQKTIDELYIEFLYDISKADEYFDTVIKGKNNNFRFENVLLEELEVFSTRGRKLKIKFYGEERKNAERKKMELL